MSDRTRTIIIACFFAFTQIGIIILSEINAKKRRQKKKLPYSDYDERQELIRGVAYRYGFLTVVLFGFFDAYFCQWVRGDVFARGVEFWLAVALGAFVIAEYEIWHDVPIPNVRRKEKGYAVSFWIVMTAALLLFTCLDLGSDVEGVLDFHELMLILLTLYVLGWLSYLARLIVRKLRDRE